MLASSVGLKVTATSDRIHLHFFSDKDQFIYCLQRPTRRVCIFPIVFYFPVSCDFEINTCSWRNEEQVDSFDWRRHRTNTPTLLTGPSYDNTKKSIYGKIRFDLCNFSKKCNRICNKSHLFRCLHVY